MVARRDAAAATRTVVVAGIPVQTTVTARPAAVRQWVYTTRWRLRRCSRYCTVGLGVQWKPLFRAGADERPATLQLCVGHRCLIFQIARADGRVPMVLRRFLAERQVTFAAYNVGLDCRKLSAHHGLVVASPLELRRLGGNNASMQDMAAEHLGLRGPDLTKSHKVGVSNWEVSTLSKKQVRYACIDAYLSYRLGVYLRHIDDDDDASSTESSFG